MASSDDEPELVGVDEVECAVCGDPGDVMVHIETNQGEAIEWRCLDHAGDDDG